MSELKHLITSDEVTQRTAATTNADSKKIRLAIPLAEGKYLRKLIGFALFNELLLFAQQGTPDTEDPLAKLLASDALKDMLSQWSLVEAWPSLLVHITDAGLTVKNGKDISSSADAAQTQSTLDAHIRIAEYYSQELTRWIEDRRKDYPSYAPPSDGVTSSNMPLAGIELD